MIISLKKEKPNHYKDDETVFLKIKFIKGKKIIKKLKIVSIFFIQKIKILNIKSLNKIILFLRKRFFGHDVIKFLKSEFNSIFGSTFQHILKFFITHIFSQFFRNFFK